MYRFELEVAVIKCSDHHKCLLYLERLILYNLYVCHLSLTTVLYCASMGLVSIYVYPIYSYRSL